ncbi:hypothetical protein SAMD00019534_115870 [Acytostelium subglobosum LB1]|uniref:hypothetical protein n=1 Tax=Acytostelium subglobosum LB1 TaxID=1410327 RepID=UPI0006449D0D|nr:hypothetical protein SAMD00019534_115870 [Acytostelium subglobosum LB1]GAM28411.1 hypothetical protein SAMD00019534_115870 [Acytostelium subglobosum LB1]|eukprot:XP_012748728.1 hypothetical protein SAMD00019534_115870 [Acytostelium subglobosum LB1]
MAEVVEILSSPMTSDSESDREPEHIIDSTITTPETTPTSSSQSHTSHQWTASRVQALSDRLNQPNPNPTTDSNTITNTDANTDSNTIPNNNVVRANNRKSKSYRFKSLRRMRRDKDISINLFELVNYVYVLMSKIGTKEDRIQSIFNLYDVFNKGYIDRYDLKSALYYRTKQNGFELSELTLENLVDNLFEQFDKNMDGRIDFSEFREEMILDATNTPVKPAIDTDSLKSHGIRTYFRIEGIKAFYIGLLCLINIGLMFYSFYTTRTHNIRQVDLFGVGLYVTRMAATLVKFNASVIVLTMCKQMATWMRGTRLRHIFPLDKSMTFHKLFAAVITIASLIHSIGWGVGFYVAMKKNDEMFFEGLGKRFTTRPTYGSLMFGSVPGITGMIMLGILIIIGITSQKRFRQRFFEGFYYTHHLFIVFYALLLIHGCKGWICPASFWQWFILPAVLYVVDRAFRLFKRTHRVTVVNCSLKNSRVINLTFARPSSFKYKPGQFILINVPQISKLQWHPFTMTSSPMESTVSVHMRVTGGWTQQLHDYLRDLETQTAGEQTKDVEKGEGGPSSGGTFEINVDGPFGSSTQYAMKEKHVMLVGAGIGVAPMASLLLDIKLKKEQINANETTNNGTEFTQGIDSKLEKVHFFWLNRDVNNFKWFDDLLVDVARTGNQIPKISLHTFTTQCIPKNDARIYLLWNGLEKMFKDQGYDPTTNLPFKTHWGRPNWDVIFSYYANKYPNETIGLYCCGPAELSKELYRQCKYYSSLRINGVRFKFHKENF